MQVRCLDPLFSNQSVLDMRYYFTGLRGSSINKKVTKHQHCILLTILMSNHCIIKLLEIYLFKRSSLLFFPEKVVYLLFRSNHCTVTQSYGKCVIHHSFSLLLLTVIIKSAAVKMVGFPVSGRGE